MQRYKIQMCGGVYVASSVATASLFRSSWLCVSCVSSLYNESCKEMVFLLSREPALCQALLMTNDF